MTRLRVVESVPEDVDGLAPRLRREDLAEVRASSGESGLEALSRGFRLSDQPKTVLWGQCPIAMFGVVSNDADPFIGCPWLLGSDAIKDHWFGFARGSLRELKILREPYRLLSNWVHEANALHVRWLEWLGAEFVERNPRHGLGREPFLRFEFINVENL